MVFLAEIPLKCISYAILYFYQNCSELFINTNTTDIYDYVFSYRNNTSGNLKKKEKRIPQREMHIS